MYRSDKDEKVDYEVFNTLGKSVFSGKIDLIESIHKYNISVAHLASGMYVLKIKDSIQKFTKE